MSNMRPFCSQLEFARKMLRSLILICTLAPLSQATVLLSDPTSQRHSLNQQFRDEGRLARRIDGPYSPSVMFLQGGDQLIAVNRLATASIGRPHSSAAHLMSIVNSKQTSTDERRQLIGSFIKGYVEAGPTVHVTKLSHHRVRMKIGSRTWIITRNKGS